MHLFEVGIFGQDEESAQIEVVLSAFNPNDVGLKNVTLDYELFHQDKRVLQGGGMRLELPPKDTARLDAVLKGNPTLYNQSEEGSLWASSVKVSKTLDIPLTGVRKEIEKSLNRAWKKMF